MKMEMEVDIKKVKELVNIDKFVRFLLGNITDIETCGFVLQILLDKIKEIENGTVHE